MKGVVAVVVLLCVAVACAERSVVQGGYLSRPGVSNNNQPFWFLGGSRARGGSNAIQTIQVPLSASDFIDDEEDDDDQEDDDDYEVNGQFSSYDDDLDDDSSLDDEQENGFSGGNILGIVPLPGGNGIGKNVWRSALSKNGANTGSILIPDGVIELEGETVVDEETGETAIFVSRESLADIPDGSVVALIDNENGSGKANTVIVRRKRRRNTGGKKRRRNNRRRRRRRGGNRRRPNGVRVVRRPIRGRTGNTRRQPAVIRF